MVSRTPSASHCQIGGLKSVCSGCWALAEGYRDERDLLKWKCHDQCKSMLELIVTLDQLTEWLQNATVAVKELPPLPLTEDGRFTLELRTNPSDANGLAAFVSYDDYSDLVETSEDIVAVVEENL